MLFKWETSGKALTMFVFKTIDNIDNRLCRAKCFIEQNRCLSYNYHINSKTCELSESDHFINPEKMVNRPGSLYTAAENTCKCAKHELCRYKPSSDTFYCVCNDNYPGSNCLAKLSLLLKISNPSTVYSTLAL
ncbi:hypothetical protein AC249_AIPGENE22715 [Exaiptasia diaphana]|nr:hypothetical protein AC249_AIPGENE22715 [Exaiptasia diaphana]